VLVTYSICRYLDGKSVPVSTPNARAISNAIFGQAPHVYNKHSISSLTAAWGQFIAHDLIMTFAHSPAETIQVPLATCDLLDSTCEGGKNLSVSRNAYDPSTGVSSTRILLNDATAYLDASTVYGQDSSRQGFIRTFSGGKLKADPINGVPPNTAAVEMGTAGHVDVRDLRLGGDVR